MNFSLRYTYYLLNCLGIQIFRLIAFFLSNLWTLGDRYFSPDSYLKKIAFVKNNPHPVDIDEYLFSISVRRSYFYCENTWTPETGKRDKLRNCRAYLVWRLRFWSHKSEVGSSRSRKEVSSFLRKVLRIVTLYDFLPVLFDTDVCRSAYCTKPNQKWTKLFYDMYEYIVGIY